MSDKQARDRVRRTLDAAARDGISDNLDLRLDVLRVLAQRHGPSTDRLAHLNGEDDEVSKEGNESLDRLRTLLSERLYNPPRHDWPEPRRASWQRESLKLAAAALVFALVGALLVVTLRGTGEQHGEPQPTPTTATTPSAVATTTLIQPTARIAVGDAPYGIAVGAGSVWIPNVGDGTLSRIDPATNAVVATIDLEATSSFADGGKNAEVFPSVAVAADGD
jgi:hypothetical protein